mmetsp:Transcript_98257/g.174122  ORF Transcript_98257/g.174122 Transcript_98257/m.174122 type:complete len:118 (+) Transcript_98257:1795-2148(+)
MPRIMGISGIASGSGVNGGAMPRAPGMVSVGTMATGLPAARSAEFQTDAPTMEACGASATPAAPAIRGGDGGGNGGGESGAAARFAATRLGGDLTQAGLVLPSAAPLCDPCNKSRRS